MQREIEGMRAKRREVEDGVEALVKTLQGTLSFIKEQDARVRDEKVLLLHRPKQAETASPSTGVAPPAEERASSQG
jgi:hypothetical protein